MKITPLNAPFGVEFSDFDVREMTDEDMAIVQTEQNKHGVIFFRDQNLTPDEHIRFAKRWGEIVINRFFERVPGYEEIAQVRKEPQHERVVGEDWHTDHSYDEAPARGSILYAREVPSSGGDTLFANMYLAYEALSDGLKDTLAGLKAWHSSRHVFSKEAIDATRSNEDRFQNHGQAVQDSLHPVVITHPLSGRKSLYVNPDFTRQFDGWTLEESRPLLEYLYNHVQQDQFIARFKWRTDSIAFWDNRATWHQAQNDYPNQRRLMHRITLEGVRLTA
ncbi:MAG: TauD/TfdA family dioxygenase [Pseudomonadota bacterium]